MLGKQLCQTRDQSIKNMAYVLGRFFLFKNFIRENGPERLKRDKSKVT